MRDSTPGLLADTYRWAKADLHLHTSEDRYDVIDYSAADLLRHARKLGFDVIAVTLHGDVLEDPRVFALAEELGVCLIPAAELRIEGADVVVLNLTSHEAAAVKSFADLRALRERRGESMLTFAPHPFHRLGGSIGDRIEEHLDCFDAIEHCHLHIPVFNPNAKAQCVAERHRLPLLATSDAHRLRFFGDHFSRLGVPVNEPLSAQNVLAAIRAGRVERVNPEGSFRRFLGLMLFLFCIHPYLKLLPANKRLRFTRAGKNLDRVNSTVRVPGAT